ncbi:hypothetical protein F5Y15DRAFT_418922 [Xylariaceae sp. FL0016]|nr:hypothetical protein F5Y15DRAFT_418922 [Xylariaceae sp. FL0016]
MAEAAGLVLGAVTLLSTFKDCIDLFSCISAAKSIGHDFEVLNAQLDIEKTLFLQWAERVRLLEPNNHDPRLGNPAINNAVSRILTTIQLVLSQSTDLQQRYGMERVVTPTAVMPGMSGPRMGRFLRDFENLALRIDMRQREISLKKRLCWVAKDKEKFESLIGRLSIFVGKLNAVIPPDAGLTEDSIRRDIRELQDLGQVQLLQRAGKDHEVPVALCAQDNITERYLQRVLDCLWFRMIDDRRISVTDAHPETLHWALSPPAAGLHWDDLSAWLRSGFDIYWVSGKAGSGKSTLMKHLLGQRQTHDLLQEWAGSSRLVTANFFFCFLGFPEQKNHHGLCRGLLYQILHAHSDLVPELLPSMWQEARKSDKASIGLPTTSEISQAFSMLGTHCSETKFCFFIDGLDEYCGDPSDGVKFIQNLASNDNIKILISSRPTPVCNQAFSHKKKLQLQDLTRSDIGKYVNSTLSAHPYFHDLQLIDPCFASTITKNVVNKASGVFLWVVLACQSLLRGFSACDYPAEIKHRIDELPPELESLFRQMLQKLEPRYQAQAAKFLRICYEWQLNQTEPCQTQGIPATAQRMEQLRQNTALEGVNTLGLALLNEQQQDFNITQVTKFIPSSPTEQARKCKMLEERLRSRCCGLLEVRNLRTEVEPRVQGSGVEDHRRLLGSVVVFLHRTVFDFLNSPDVWDLEHLRINDSDFDPNAALSRLHVNLAHVLMNQDQATVGYSTQGVRVQTLIIQSLICAIFVAETSSKVAAFTLRSAVLATVQYHTMFEDRNSKHYNPHLTFFTIGQPICSARIPTTQAALMLASELGMTNALQYWEESGIFPLSHHPLLLFHALEKLYSNWLLSFGLDLPAKTIRYLLSRGCDLNFKTKTSSGKVTTPWECWLLIMAFSSNNPSGLVAADITESFLAAGADLRPVIPIKFGTLEQLIHRRLMENSIQGTYHMNSKDQAMKARRDDVLRLLRKKRAEEAVRASVGKDDVG